MKRTDIHLRDPFVLPHDGVYYLYGTRADNVWGAMDGFDCYTSRDLDNWEGPFEVFHKPDEFTATVLTGRPNATSETVYST